MVFKPKIKKVNFDELNYDEEENEEEVNEEYSRPSLKVPIQNKEVKELPKQPIKLNSEQSQPTKEEVYALAMYHMERAYYLLDLFSKIN